MIEGEFTLKITLGNAGMCEVEHVAEALREVAQRFVDFEPDGRIRDENGNAVGTYALWVAA